MRQSVQDTIIYVKGKQIEGRITKEQSRTLVRSLRDFDDQHRGYSRHNFALEFIFWAKTNIYDILMRYEAL